MKRKVEATNLSINKVQSTSSIGTSKFFIKNQKESSNNNQLKTRNPHTAYKLFETGVRKRFPRDYSGDVECPRINCELFDKRAKRVQKQKHT